MNWTSTAMSVPPAPPARPPVRPMAPPVSAMPQDTLTLNTPAWELTDLQTQIAALIAATPAPAPVPAPTPAPVAAPAPKPAAPEEPKAEAKPKAESKPKPKPKAEPKKNDDRKNDDEKYAKRLNAHLHGAYWKASIQCFRYAWNVVARSGGRSIGQATQSRDGRGKSTAYLGQMVKEGRVRVGDIVYINRKPGADPTSTVLSYKPHWFVYIGNGKFADQFGERDAAAMDRGFSGRKIDTIYRTN
jgi:hypothetical protein